MGLQLIEFFTSKYAFIIIDRSMIFNDYKRFFTTISCGSFIVKNYIFLHQLG